MFLLVVAGLGDQLAVLVQPGSELFLVLNLGSEQEGELYLMLKHTTLVECGQGVHGGVGQAKLTHVVVDVELLLDLRHAFVDDSGELALFAGYALNQGLKNEQELITRLIS